MFGSVMRRKICQPRAPRLTAAISSSEPIASISGISSRATNGKVTNAVARIEPGRGEDDLDVVLAQPRAEVALQAEDQHEDQAGDHRRDGERQVDQRRQQRAAGEAEAGDRPGRGDAEDRGSATTAIGATRQRQQDRAAACRGRRPGCASRRRGPSAKRLVEDVDHRDDDQDADRPRARRRSAPSAPTAGSSLRARRGPAARCVVSCHGACSSVPAG